MLLRKTYGIDLGSSTIKVYSFLKNKSYMEKNMVASKGHTIIAIGNEAYEMFEKSPVNIAVNSPMTFGMIANLELQEIALYSMMKKIDKFLGIGSDMFFSVPLDMTAIEKRAYYHVVNGHWLRQNRVYMVEAPIADALAMGIRMEKNEGSMVVNIGAQSTQFSILTDGNIIMSRKVPIGGRQMNEAICAEIRKRYNLQIGTRTGKRLKIAMGRLNDQRKDARKVVGIDSISGLSKRGDHFRICRERRDHGLCECNRGRDEDISGTNSTADCLSYFQRGNLSYRWKYTYSIYRQLSCKLYRRIL